MDILKQLLAVLAKQIGGSADTFLEQIVIPELMTAVREHFAKTGQILTDADVIQQLQQRADAIVKDADAFLVKKGAENG